MSWFRQISGSKMAIAVYPSVDDVPTVDLTTIVVPGLGSFTFARNAEKSTSTNDAGRDGVDQLVAE